MSYLSAQAKMDIETEGKKIKLGHKSKTVHRDYTDFSGSIKTGHDYYTPPVSKKHGAAED